MRSNRVFLLIAAGLLMILFLSSCVTLKSAGVFTAPAKESKLVTLSELEANPARYHIYYTGLSWDMPAAILFDPKGDDMEIRGKFWVRLDKGGELHQMINFIKSFINFNPRLYAVTAPDGQVFGYILTSTFPIQARMIDEKTIYVYDIESPLYQSDGGIFKGATIY